MHTCTHTDPRQPLQLAGKTSCHLTLQGGPPEAQVPRSCHALRAFPLLNLPLLTSPQLRGQQLCPSLFGDQHGLCSRPKSVGPPFTWRADAGLAPTATAAPTLIWPPRGSPAPDVPAVSCSLHSSP